MKQRDSHLLTSTYHLKKAGFPAPFGSVNVTTFIISDLKMIKQQSVLGWMPQKKLIEFPVSTGPYMSFIDHIVSLAADRTSSYVCIANVHMFVEAYNDQDFMKVIRRAAIVTPDGKPLAWGMRTIHSMHQDRVAGMDLLPDLLEKMVQKNLSAYFYGGSPSLLKQTASFVNNHYPHLNAAGFYSPPFRALTAAEDLEIIDNINSSGANVVFVVLGCPKQEKWMASMQGKINACMIGIGGALPVMVGLQKRAPAWMQRVGMEWFFRFCQEPRRLFKRYAVTNTMFFYLAIREFMKVRLLKKGTNEAI
jgi:N-acetylglucosaminyldiphosphoundecaprenol N-acetyl-beta-D-mannosaminyltransferase